MPPRCSACLTQALRPGCWTTHATRARSCCVGLQVPSAPAEAHAACTHACGRVPAPNHHMGNALGCSKRPPPQRIVRLNGKATGRIMSLHNAHYSHHVITHYTLQSSCHLWSGLESTPMLLCVLAGGICMHAFGGPQDLTARMHARGHGVGCSEPCRPGPGRPASRPSRRHRSACPGPCSAHSTQHSTVQHMRMRSTCAQRQCQIC